ncbi:ABC transporter permease [Staphylococcus intermedius]|uniref:ABC transporter, permease protein n=1 Tax=Staphylococcus intermedius NCTC 11048 TaxID=1141106 RepID=A0A380G5E1_STAIN|nr:ABC transporter permease [Staphylococcus intermedius]PCF64127.1 ABC transporter permease [Staphylococcus intermedius]PCF79815.1 ABC transporter permease [Staphylococcus intermedius]PCF85004.1 ABC transporter permease [Staphylococcus intermedius]PCF89526.1 ABC transporter permease [Staphylococcus intermedius]PNZ54803.1 ABC transporter permease [Staphylococcus intermedius NCTC 11048]
MNAWYIAKRVYRQVFRDKRTLALLFLAPLLILSLLTYLFNSTDQARSMHIGVNQVPDNFVAQLEKQDIHVHQYDNSRQIEQKIKDDRLSAFINVTDDTLHVTFANDNPNATTIARQQTQQWLTKANTNQMKTQMQALQATLQKMQNELKAHPEIAKQLGNQTAAKPTHSAQPLTLKTDYLYKGQDATYFDMINPLLIGFFVFFFTFLISGIALLRERTTGTLERLLASPIKRSHIILGYIIGYGTFSFIQTLLIVCFSVFVLNIGVNGSIGYVILITLVIALVALTLGILLSTFAASEFQMIQFIPIVIVPQVLFAGIIPVESMNNILQGFAHIMPLYYAGQALQNVMIRGFGFEAIAVPLAILFAIFIVLLILNMVGMKRYRKV